MCLFCRQQCVLGDAAASQFDGQSRIVFSSAAVRTVLKMIMQRVAKSTGPFPFRGPDEGLLMGARNVEPVNGGGDWVYESGSLDV